MLILPISPSILNPPWNRRKRGLGLGSQNLSPSTVTWLLHLVPFWFLWTQGIPASKCSHTCCGLLCDVSQAAWTTFCPIIKWDFFISYTPSVAWGFLILSPKHYTQKQQELCSKPLKCCIMLSVPNESSLVCSTEISGYLWPYCFSFVKQAHSDHVVSQGTREK